MMKRFTTSAQKTLSLSRKLILAYLEQALPGDHQFQRKNKPGGELLIAKLADGSKIVLAAFDKPNGKTLAMIDHQNLPGDLQREVIQQELRAVLQKAFGD